MAVKRVTEKAFQNAVMTYAKLHGWRCVHFTPGMVPTKGGKRWVTPFTGDRGFPDTVFLRAGQLVFAELKVGRNTATADQVEWIRLLVTVDGIGAYLWTPADWSEIERVLGGTS